MTVDDNILDDLFHFCALRAYLERAAIEQGTPDMETTRRRAYELYEEAIAQKNGDKTALAGRRIEHDDGNR